MNDSGDYLVVWSGNGIGDADGVFGQRYTSEHHFPLATADTYSVNEDNTLNIAATGVLANDSDPDNDPLTVVLVSGPANGTVTLNADGSFSYTPDADFNGTDSFTYQANDGSYDSNVATVTITVNEQNDTPPPGYIGDFEQNILPGQDDPPIQLDPVLATPYVPIDDAFSGSSPLLDFPDSDESGDELGVSTGDDDPEISEETSDEGESESSSEPAQQGEPVAESGDSQAGTETSLAESGTDGHFEATVSALLSPEVLALLSGKTELSHLLDEMEEGINQLGDLSLPEITIVSTTFLTAGYVIYDLRKLCFIFTAISSIPHWRQFDLLSVLNTNTSNESNSKRKGMNPLVDIVHGG